MGAIFLATFLIFALGQVESKPPVGGGLKSCKDTPFICKNICESSFNIYNPVATILFRHPECDDEGICHCGVEQAPGTSDKIRAPEAGEETCKCNEPTVDTIETPSVYHDRQTPESKYCVCFSAFRKGKKEASTEPINGNSSDIAASTS